MAAPPQAVAAVRVAVRSALRGVTGPVLVACSGGADSLALAAAAAFLAPREGFPAGLVSVDHGLQAGSTKRALQVADWGTTLGLSPSVSVSVEVDGRPGGPEAAARDARYEALVAEAKRHDAGTVLLGHTRDDQAETVLLALLRGAGTKGLAGMPPVRDIDGVRFVRPLLDVPRAYTRAAAATLTVPAWDDPHNHDPSFARARARTLLHTLAEGLGPAVVDNLARTAALVAADAAVLEDLAAASATEVTDADGTLDVTRLGALSDAIRGRVLHRWARSLGCPGSTLSHRHVKALDALVTAWHGQGPVALPGGVWVTRTDGRLRAGGKPSDG